MVQNSVARVFLKGINGSRGGNRVVWNSMYIEHRSHLRNTSSQVGSKLSEIDSKRHSKRYFSTSDLKSKNSESSNNSDSSNTGFSIMAVGSRLALFRKELNKRGLDGYIVPHNDAHFSEYIAQHDERVAYISGFTGSAGTVVITKTEALLWTDGRYWLQAGNQLGIDKGDTTWTLMKSGAAKVPNVREWLASKKFTSVGCDPWLTSSEDCSDMIKHGIPLTWEGKPPTMNGNGSPKMAAWSPESFKEKLGQVFGTPTSSPKQAPQQDSAARTNLVDFVHTEMKDTFLTPRPTNYVYKVKNCKSMQDKVADLKLQMKANGADVCLITELDEIAWILNIRGSDIAFNPVFFGFLLILDKVTKPVLYTDWPRSTTKPSASKVAGEDIIGGALEGVQIKPYLNIAQDLKAIVNGPQWKVWCNPDVLPVKLADVIKSNPAAGASLLMTSPNLPIASWKAVKNDTELQGMKDAHIRDGVSKTKYLMWLEDMAKSNGYKPNLNLTEVSAADKLESLRSMNEKFVGLSFGTISSSGPNGAIIHYHPEGQTPIDPETLYLCDSGAQYLDGTTDVTRTVYLGKDTNSEKFRKFSHHFTLVLQGHIALATAKFPTGTPGPALDVLARMPLWKHKLNYQHGTGHGVGAHLCVHEGPHGIPMLRSGPKSQRMLTVLNEGLKPGMVVSNEPGYYCDGSHGIRIENLVAVKKFQGINDAEYCSFENLTFIPLDKRLIDMDILLAHEKQYVDEYHAECYAKLSPFFHGAEEKERLKKMCDPLESDSAKRRRVS